MRHSNACAPLALLVVSVVSSPAAAFSFCVDTCASRLGGGGGFTLLKLASETVTQDEVSTKTGTVAWFNAFKGFGFISMDDGSGDVYVHHSNIVMDGFRKLEEGERVGFMVGRDTSERGTGKLYAYDVTELGSSTDDESTGEDGDLEENEEVAAMDAEVATALASTEHETVEAEKERAVNEVAPSVPAGPVAQEKDYGKMDLGEQAFHILLDIGAVTLTPDPDSPDYDHSKDDELAPENVNIG